MQAWCMNLCLHLKQKEGYSIYKTHKGLAEFDLQIVFPGVGI